MHAVLNGRNGAIELFDTVNHRRFEDLEVVGNNNSQNLLVALKTASAEGWLPQLVATAYQRSPDPGLQAVLGSLSLDSSGEAIDQFERCRLNGGFWLIDRGPLRDSMRELNLLEGRRILLVNGKAKSGKSYSRRLMYHLEESLGTFALAEIDLEQLSRLQGPDRALQPNHVAEALVDQLGYRDLTVPEPPENEAWARWVWDFCEDLQPVALQDQDRHWVVIDGFNKIVMTQPLADLIKELSVRVSRRLNRFRLVLLGYGDELPIDTSPTVRSDQLDIIGAEHLTDFFIGYLKEVSVTLTDETLADRLADTVQAVLDGLDPTEPDYLVELTGRVGPHLLTLAGP
jgi:hypothetical protein